MRESVTVRPAPGVDSALGGLSIRAGLYVRALAWPVAIMLVALFLRTYHLQLTGWVPDTYERLTDASLIAHGHLPQSRLAPPGISAIMAVPFLVFPDTLMTMQLTTVAFSIALVGVAFFAALKLTNDRTAAILFGSAIALDPLFVYFSRDSLYDIINTFFVAAAIFLVPALRGRKLGAYACYGAILGILIAIRATNAVVVPIALLYWLEPFERGINPTRTIRSLLSANVIATGVVMALLTAATILCGRWFGNASQAPVTLENYVANIGFYADSLSHGPLGAIVMWPLALAGSIRLWRINRSLLATVLLVIVSFPIVFSPFRFASDRYMLPSEFFLLFLVAMGVVELWARSPRWTGRTRGLAVAFALLALTVFGVRMVGGPVVVVARWPATAARSNEGNFREMRPIVAGLPDNSLLVSAITRGVVMANPRIEYIDLIDHSLDNGTGPESVAMVDARIADALAHGRRVYYLFSHWDAGSDFEGTNGRQGYNAYFESVQQYRISTILELPSSGQDKIHWSLFELEP